MERARRNMTVVLATLTAALGIAMIVSTLVRGGSATAIGLVVGAAFALIGSGRVYLAVSPRQHRDAR